MKTITTKAGAKIVLATRSDAEKAGFKFITVSSASAQPFVASNFNIAGENIGGRTMSQAEVDHFLVEAAKVEATIEGEI